MSNCLCYCLLPLSGNDTSSQFGGTPRRQDVRKTHRMTEVCLTDTYTGVQKLSLFLLCCVSSKPCPIWNNTLEHTHTLASTCQLYSHVCVQNTSEKGIKGTGSQAWWKILMELWGPVSPNTSSLTRITGNPHRKRFHTTGPAKFPPKKQKVTKSLLHATLHPHYTQSVFIFPTQEPCNQAFCSKPTKNKQTKNSPTTKTQSC